MKTFVVALAAFLAVVAAASAQAPAAATLKPNRVGEMDRPLRYHPEGLDFVIANGAEFFNRPLYGGNTAFRADAGDRPEFTLYLPGRGGNLRFGLKSAKGSKWLQNAEQVIARYRPGTMRYEVQDVLLGRSGVLELVAIALPMTDGLIIRIEGKNISAGVELVWAYGGVTGVRGKRDGDIGTEDVPIGEYFQLQPEFCRGNGFMLAPDSFTLRSKPATIVGRVSAHAALALADAKNWSSLDALLNSSPAGGAAPVLPVVVGRVALTTEAPLYFTLQRIAEETAKTSGDLETYREVRSEPANAKSAKPSETNLPLLPAFRGEDLSRVFEESENYFQELRTRVAVETPDPFLDAAVAALNVAADAVWDEPQHAIMHGAIAWRTRLLGWRGPYLLDALGWPERARQHFSYWAGRQNLDPIPEKLPPADENANLARNEAGLHSNGDLSNSHYDMNLVYIDALFRHLLWTGDLEFARSVWPVIERHLAWERRLFRREFGPEKLPLYEAYAAIWASDDLQYGGGGTAHASAYNYYHNKMAARLAKLLGKDPAIYEREAGLIARAMREYLWLPEQGMFAESKDLLGRQLVHPSAALWTFYHTLDSELVTPAEAWRIADYVGSQIPRLPVSGFGVPNDASYSVLASTDWMPYSWSINNVVMGENVHTALGLWQAGRGEDAFRLLKSSVLASMFMGISPGNVGSMNYLDVYRRESQRDFADGSGVLSRAVVEGLFGVKPDALAGELRIAPGFPAAWLHAKLVHPQVSLEYQREGQVETFKVASRFAHPMQVHLEIPARGDAAAITVNGQPVDWRLLALPAPRIEIIYPAITAAKIVVTWTGLPRRSISVPAEARKNRAVEPAQRDLQAIDWRKPLVSVRRLEAVDLTPYYNAAVTEIFRPGKYVSPRSPYVSLALPSQGIGAWAGHVNEMAVIDDRGLRSAAAANGGRLVLPNGVGFATPSAPAAKNVIFTSQWDNYPREVTVPLAQSARHAYVLMAGSTNGMQSRLDNGELIVTYTDGTAARLALRNPTTWWPIEQDYFIDDYQFRDDAPLPPRVDLKTGRVRLLDAATFKGQGGKIEGGAATVLDLPLAPGKPLHSLTVRALANEVVIGLMSVTLERE